MNKIEIQVVDSPETNDHEAIILADGIDILGDDYMGLDPPKFFQQEMLISGGQALIGRCNCGCEGCSDLLADITVSKLEVFWNLQNGLKFCFNREQYDKEITFKRQDFSWENNERKAERLVDSIFKSTALPKGWAYDWASARIKERIISLSFNFKSEQKILEFEWNCKDPYSAEKNAIKLKTDIISGL